MQKNGMTRHLKSCIEKKVTAGNEGSGKKIGNAESLIISVVGRYDSQYWLYLEMPINTKLIALDKFLRNIWLECCGHMSAFKIRGYCYSIAPDYGWEEKDMDFYLRKVLSMGEQFTHEYDFGTPTELTLKVIGVAAKVFPDKGIAILARNNEPRYKCDNCNKVAIKICQGCSFEGKGWLCKECAEKHPCGEDMLLPVVNSPRVGTCGYIG
jgi:predicted RNA-binding Zn-ribbon protein involved in translation (DUF1610 family)